MDNEDSKSKEDSDNKSVFNSTVPNTAKGVNRVTTPNENFVSTKLEIDTAQVHMNDLIKENENKDRNPLAFRFKKIANIQVGLQN